MKITPQVLLLAVALLLCLPLCACGGGKSSDETKTVTITSNESQDNDPSSSDSNSEPESSNSSSEQDAGSATTTESTAYQEPVDEGAGKYRDAPVPFWGIWIGAFSDPNNANNFEAEAKAKGLLAGQEISSDWTNLNQNTYHVVYAGAYYSEAEAQADLARIQGMGYPDAYVKYSGEYKYV